MSNPDQTLTNSSNPQLLEKNKQKEEEQKNSVQLSQPSTIEEHKTDENKKEKRRAKKKKGFKKLQTIAQELQHEFSKFLKISYIDETLNIRGFQKRITDENLQELLSALKKQLEENNLTLTLTRLNLKLSRCLLLTDSAVDILVPHFGTTFKHLEYLNFDFNHSYRNKISEEAMIKIINSIGLQLQNLKHLNLNLYSHPYQENNRTEFIVNNLLANLPGLRSFNITSPLNYYSKEREIFEYIRTISNLPLLENLTLDLGSSQITDQGFTEVADQIGNNLPHLKYLSLRFDHQREMSEKSLINFFRVIGPSFKKLETLELSLRTRKQNLVTDQALERLANKFNDNFQTLKSLVVNFEGCSKLTSEGVYKFNKSIGTNLKNLKNLDLNFNGVFHLDDETMKSFAFLNNEHLPELESLKLAIAGSKITDQGLKNFLTAFEGKSESLKELSLDLSGCKQLTEHSIRYLGNHLPQTFKNLKNLKLILRNHKQIMTPKMRASLAKSFRTIRKHEVILGN